MTPLNLRPLPCLRIEESTAIHGDLRDGFVDDGVAMALVAGPTVSRGIPRPEDLALAADDMDFAGWRLTTRPFSGMNWSAVAAVHGGGRRAVPPVLDEPGLGEPHQGNHRWWLAGLAGAMSTLLFSLLLLTLASRESVSATDGIFSKVPARTAGSAPAPVAVPVESRTGDPQLTAVEPWEGDARESGDGGQ